MLTPDEWIDEMSAEGYSPATTKSYRWHLNHLLKFLNKDVRQIEPRDLKAYLAHRRGGGWGDATIKMAINAIQSFFSGRSERSDHRLALLSHLALSLSCSARSRLSRL